jgi:hypothetical protein
MAAGRAVSKQAEEHGISKRIDLSLRLFQAYAVSVGMYAAQIWSTPYLRQEAAFDSEVQQAHLTLLRRLVKVKQGTCRQSLLHELGQRTFQHYWWRSVVRFWNKIVHSDNSLLRDVVRSEVELAAKGLGKSWAWEVKRGLESMGAREEVAKLMGNQEMDLDEVMHHVETKRQEFWGRFAVVEQVREEKVENRKALTYGRWFKQDVAPLIPKYFSFPQVTYSEAIKVAKFRLGSHELRVEKGKVFGTPWIERKCIRCPADYLCGLDCQVDDEYHMIFECKAFEHLRSELSLLQLIPTDLTSSNIVDFKDWRVCKFIASCMELIGGAEVALEPLQAEQPAG